MSEELKPLTWKDIFSTMLYEPVYVVQVVDGEDHSGWHIVEMVGVDGWTDSAGKEFLVDDKSWQAYRRKPEPE